MPGIEPELLRSQPGVLPMSYTHPSSLSSFSRVEWVRCCMWENAADGKPTNEKVEDRLEKERDECKKMINNSARHERAGLHICKQPRLLAGTACSQKCYYLCIDKLQASLYPKISHAYTMIPVAHQGSPGQRFEPQYLKMSHHISYKKPSSPKDPSHLVMNHHILCWKISHIF